MLTTIIIVFIIFIIFVIGIISSIFSKAKNEGIPYKVGKKFIKDFNPKINEDVIFWHNERTDEINIYLKGTSGGQGKIGIINSKEDLKKLENDSLNAFIKNIGEDTIFIKFY